jgi:phosphoglycolate phosphatase/pyrophosphatase PpaX
VLDTRLRGVIFDLDGTLADTLPLCIAAFRLAVEPLAARTLTDAEIIATFGPSEEGTIRALAPDHFAAGLAGYLRHYEALHDTCPAPFAGVPALLAFLKARGARLGLVTGKGAGSAWISLRRFGLADVFEAVETGDPSGPVKAGGLRRILAGWRMAPEQAVYVGDAPSDILAARAAGVPVVGAAWAGTADRARLAALHPDALLTSVADLKAWLESRLG